MVVTSDHRSTRRRLRRQEIRDAAVPVVANQGVRALTHRAVDRAARLPTGTTSHYAPTRAALIELVVEELFSRAERSSRSLHENLGQARDIDELVETILKVVGVQAAYEVELKARYALLADAESKALNNRLETELPPRTASIGVLERVLAKLGLATPIGSAHDLVDLCAGLIWLRTTCGLEPDIRSIVAHYLHGAATAAPVLEDLPH